MDKRKEVLSHKDETFLHDTVGYINIHKHIGYGYIKSIVTVLYSSIYI